MAPSKKNKKQPKNAFYFFLLKYKESHGQAVANLSEHDFSNEAADYWDKLPYVEKNKFEEMARKCREGGEKYTSLGVPISVQEELQAEKLKSQESIKQDIINLILALSCSDNHLLNYRFYFLHFNCFVRTERGFVVPAEIAVSEFTLINGVQRQYSEFLDIRDIPAGYSCTAKDVSEKIHKIPLPPKFSLANTDAVEVFRKVHNFLLGLHVDSMDTEHYAEQPLPMIFTASRELDIVSQCMGALVAETHIVTPLVMKIYPLEQLFYQLQVLCYKRLSNKSIPRPTLSLAEIELEKDRYNYASDVACEFHEDADERPNCSRSKVIRWGYLIADYCCGPFEIQMVDMLHCPRNTTRMNSNPGMTLEDVQKLHNNIEDPKVTEKPWIVAGRGRGRGKKPTTHVPGGRDHKTMEPTLSVNKNMFEDQEWYAVEDDPTKPEDEFEASDFNLGRPGPSRESSSSTDVGRAGPSYSEPLRANLFEDVGRAGTSRSEPLRANLFEDVGEPRQTYTLYDEARALPVHDDFPPLVNKTWNTKSSTSAQDFASFAPDRQFRTSSTGSAWQLPKQTTFHGSNEPNFNQGFRDESRFASFRMNTPSSSISAHELPTPNPINMNQQGVDDVYNQKYDYIQKNEAASIEAAQRYTPSLRVPRTEVLRNATSTQQLEPTIAQQFDTEDSRAATPSYNMSIPRMSHVGTDDDDDDDAPLMPRTMSTTEMIWRAQTGIGIGRGRSFRDTSSTTPSALGGISLSGVGRGRPIKQEPDDTRQNTGGRLAASFKNLKM